jgi:uncharacterized membrane protein YdjX (TVP38/TMEM64 family)
VSEHAEPTTHRKWIHIPLIVFLLGIVGAFLYFYFAQYDRLSSGNLQAFVRDFGPWAPVAYAGIYVAVAPIPMMASLLSPIGGLLFGALWGSVLVVVTATLSSLIPFALSRQLGQEWVASKLEGRKLESIYRRSEGQGGFVFILMMRLVPVLPWEVQSYVAGVTKVSIPVYLLATAIGILPGSASLVLLGDAVADPTSWRFVLAIALNAVFIVGTPLVAALLQRRRQKQHSEEKEGPA